jgi:hypothetical protein
MFLTVAEYEDNYIRYLQKKVSVDEAGFLKMYQLGPFQTNEGNNMDLLAALLKIVIPYAIAYPPTRKSPSPPPSPRQSRATKEKRGKQPAAAQGPGPGPRDPSPVAALAEGVRTMTVTGDPAEVEATPQDTSQQNSRVLRSHTASHQNQPPTGQPAGAQIGQPGAAQHHGSQPAAPQRGHGDGGRGGPGRGQGRGQDPGQGQGQGQGRGQDQNQGPARGGKSGGKGGKRGGRGK